MISVLFFQVESPVQPWMMHTGCKQVGSRRNVEVERVRVDQVRVLRNILQGYIKRSDLFPLRCDQVEKEKVLIEPLLYVRAGGKSEVG